MRKIFLFLLLVAGTLYGFAEEGAAVSSDSTGSYASGLALQIEASGTFGNGKYSPLWLVSNRHGMVSPYSNSGYQRAYLYRDAANDSTKKWRMGYGLDVMVAEHAQSWFMLHQAYYELQFMKARLQLGIRERELESRNPQLSSGAMAFGINAQPIPMGRIDVDYFSFPGTRQWLKFKTRFAFGIQTDYPWQKNWVGDANTMKYNKNTLYHEKAIFAKVGREEKFPLILEFGVQMESFFGGTSYNVEGRNYHSGEPLRHAQGVRAFWDAIWPMYTKGEMDGVNQGAAGNQLGSYLVTLSWKDKGWGVRAYYEHFFETGNSMLFRYGFKDHLIGIEGMLPKNPFVSNIVLEHFITKDQSGPVFHDPTANMPDHISGINNYYNHNIYNGYQHWGMSMGSPFITSPIYNDDHAFTFRNNRVGAWHVGLSGEPCDEVSWRVLMSFTRNWGTYYRPLRNVLTQNSFLVEADYHPHWSKGVAARIGLGIDDGNLIGTRFGGQLTIAKTFRLVK